MDETNWDLVQYNLVTNAFAHSHVVGGSCAGFHQRCGSRQMGLDTKMNSLPWTVVP